MSYLTVKVNMNDWGIETKLASAAAKAEHAVAVQAASDTDPYVPFLTGKLKNSAKPENIKGNVIVYDGPYARYLYYGKVEVFKDPPHLRQNKKGKMVLSHYGQKKVPIEKDLQLAHSGIDPNAQAFWFEASKAQNLDKWKKTAAEAIVHDFKK